MSEGEHRSLLERASGLIDLYCLVCLAHMDEDLDGLARIIVRNGYRRITYLLRYQRDACSYDLRISDRVLHIAFRICIVKNIRIGNGNRMALAFAAVKIQDIWFLVHNRHICMPAVSLEKAAFGIEDAEFLPVVKRMILTSAQYGQGRYGRKNQSFHDHLLFSMKSCVIQSVSTRHTPANAP